MSEQRQQAYLDLIQQLLDCRSEEEWNEILAANQDLIDAEFLLMVETVAEMMSEQGNQNTANWLWNFGNQLAEYLNQSEDFVAYFQVLKEILLATSESNRDAEVVYPLFAANTDKLDDTFAEILRH